MTKLTGSAEWHRDTLTFRLSREADPTRKRRNLREYYAGPLPEDRALAKRFAHEFAHRMSTGILEMGEKAIAPASSRDETVRDWCKRWRAWRVKMGYVADETEDAKNFRCYIEPIIGDRPIRVVRSDEIEAIVASLDARIVANDETRLSWKTAGNAWTCLRAMFRDAVTAKPASGLRVDRADNPTLTVAAPEKPKKGTPDKLKTYLYPSEYLALMTAPALWDPAQGRAKRLSANIARAKAARRWLRIFTIAIYQALRANEIKGLEWAWIDLEHWIGKVEKQADGEGEADPKCGSFREFTFEPAIRPLILAMHAEAKAANGGKAPTGRIFPSFPNEGDLAARLRDYLALADCTRAELSTRNAHRVPMRFHDLRATGITWMAMRGDDAIDIQALAGHKSIVTTEKYIRRVRRIRGASWGEPFPPVPAIVLGPETEARPPAVPHLSPEMVKLAKHLNKIASPRGFEACEPAEMAREAQHFAPSVPRNVTEHPPSTRPVGVDAVTSALRIALDTAIAEGRRLDAAQLATELAARANAVTAPNVVALPIQRR
jgi:integrase